MNTSPLIEGFRLGITPPQIDTAHGLSVKDKLTIPEADGLAQRYDVTQRTDYRWKSFGVDVRNPHAVADYLLAEKQPSTAAIRLALKILQSTENTP